MAPNFVKAHLVEGHVRIVRSSLPNGFFLVMHPNIAVFHPWNLANNFVKAFRLSILKNGIKL